MGIDFSQFKDLTPERRARELQKVIENLKNEIEDRQKDLKDAEKRLAEAYEEARIIEHVSIPETKQPKIKETIEEKTEEKPKRTRDEKAELEKLLATAPRRSQEVVEQVARRPVQELYGELRKIYQREQQTGLETSQDREMLYAIRRGLEEKKKDVQEGQYNPGAKAKHLLSAAEQMADSMYNSAGGTYKTNPN